MLDPLLSRGARARLAVVIAIGLGVVACGEAPRLARVDDAGGQPCTATFAAAQSLVTAWGGGALTRADDNAVAGLRAIDADSADAAVAGPVRASDSAYVAQLPDESEAYVFALGDKVCGGIEIVRRGALPALNASGVSPAGPKL